MELNNDNIEPKKRYEYTPCYCEENIWKWLDTQLSENQDGLYYAVFISNPSANVFFWNHSGKEYVIWDYHVIGLFKRSKTDSMWKVMDFDGKSFMKPVTDDPCEGMVELNQYLSQCFTDIPREHFVPRFRVVSAKNYIKYFSSDRSHMWDSQSQSFKSPPPSYGCIKAGNESMNLYEYLNMDFKENTTDIDSKFGKVFSLEQLTRTFNCEQLD